MRSAKDPTERQLHVSIVDFFSIALPPGVVFSHAPGEGRRGWRGQADLRDLGYFSGWPDIEIVSGGRVYFLEIKSVTGHLTPAQRFCHDMLRKAGSQVEVVQSLDEVKFWLDRWGIPIREGVRLT